MEEVKQDQGPGDGAAGQAIVKPTAPFKPAPGKVAAAKNATDVKKALLNKKKGGNDAAWFIQELRDISLLFLY